MKGQQNNTITPSLYVGRNSE